MREKRTRMPPQKKLDSIKKQNNEVYLNRDFDSDHYCGFPCWAKDLEGNDLEWKVLLGGGFAGFFTGLCCAPCVVGRAFEELHPLQQYGPDLLSNYGNFVPRTILGCALCLTDGMMPWAIAYIGSHSRNKTTPANCVETVSMCCAGSVCLPFCCAPCQIAGELRETRRGATGPYANLLDSN